MSVLSRFMRSAPSRPNAPARPVPARTAAGRAVSTRSPGLKAPARVANAGLSPAPALLTPPGAMRDGAGLRELVGLWLWRAKARRELAQLDDARLADVGISPETARREARKPFWQA